MYSIALPSFRPISGDIYICKSRKGHPTFKDNNPVLVLATGRPDDFIPTVVVAPIATVIKRLDMDSHVLLKPNHTFTEYSTLMLEQTKRIDITELECFIGRIGHEDRVWKHISKSIKSTREFYMAANEQSNKASQESTCLCYKCLRYYSSNPVYQINRLSSINGKIDKCDRCGLYHGFEYLITEKGVE